MTPSPAAAAGGGGAGGWLEILDHSNKQTGGREWPDEHRRQHSPASSFTVTFERRHRCRK